MKYFHLQQERGRPLPKFGEWDVNNPASAEGFTVIFNKARDEKKTNVAERITSPKGNGNGYKQNEDFRRSSKVYMIIHSR